MMGIIFNSFKVKYIKLKELLNDCDSIEKFSTVNVYINLEDILTKMSSSGFDEYLRVQKEERVFEFISNLINLVAHYRLFFVKNQINARIYVYIPYPFDCKHQKNRVIHNKYRSRFEERLSKNAGTFVLSEMLRNAIPFVKLIFEYIEGVYFIESGNIENSVIPYTIMNVDGMKGRNFIISKNVYDFQYVNYDTSIIIPKQEESILIDKDNVISSMCVMNNIDIDTLVSPLQLPFILSIVGDKRRSIYGLKGIGMKKAFKMVNSALKDGLFTSNTDNITLLLGAVKPELSPTILSNYYCTDIKSQYIALSVRDIYDITTQLIDKFDNVSLKELNDKYFTDYPLQLVEVTATAKKKTPVVFD